MNKKKYLTIKKYSGRWMSYGHLQEVVQEEGITSRAEFRKWWQSWTLYKVCSLYPERYYSEWESWPVFLKNKNHFGQNHKQFASFEECLSWARKSGIRTSAEYLNKATVLPDFVPRHPEKYFFGKGWVNWQHYLGTKIVHWLEQKKMDGGMRRKYSRGAIPHF